jgi:hypothetical protein
MNPKPDQSKKSGDKFEIITIEYPTSQVRDGLLAEGRNRGRPNCQSWTYYISRDTQKFHWCP